MTDSVRLDDITSATNTPILKGILVFNEIGGAGVFRVDLSDADTIGDVVDAINAAAQEAGSNLTASLSDTGLIITPGSTPVTISDASAGEIAAALGILTTEATSGLIEGDALTERFSTIWNVYRSTSRTKG